MTGKQLNTRLSAYGICVQDGRILLARWVHGDGPLWSLPGGGVDFGEDPWDAVVREVAEETGYDFEADTLLGIDNLHRPGRFHGVRVYYEGRIVGGELRHEVNGSTDMAAWFDLAELDSLPVSDLVGPGLALARNRPATGHTPLAVEVDL
ncbi:NUDIX hydrolase [Actinokineospora xionganensis]|uniref:NUDIX domain-containing protein n=1 Tax=Actinokineospora xionganensis TaxID=2684470 RepID=A0ABR7LCG8_9PSEU|nr:NUDIX domain-containing protein [Actinokineospora xionganensis]MBC6450081.1 NUDIX domain-containing protein [Actinokineospora xionganensis]